MNSTIQPGRILAGRYRIEKQIGIGGMAVVYRAVDLNTHHYVAVKVLKAEHIQDEEFVARFQREAEAASKLTHSNIVNLLDVGMDTSGNRFLVMEYVEGQTLKEVIREKGQLSESSAVQITIRILSALQHAHENGIIHRDIKPQNILMQSDGHVKVADFGIARMLNKHTLTKGDTVMGTVHYFSPEQASGHEMGVTTDIYSVGVTLYEMLTGRVPFDGDTPLAIAMQHLRNAPPPIHQFAPNVSDAVCHICMKAMEKNPAYRYQSAWDMAADLRRATSGRIDEMEPRIVDTAANTASQRRQPSSRMVRKEHSASWWVITVLLSLSVCYGLFAGIRIIYDSVVNSAVVDDYIGVDVTQAQKQILRLGLRSEVVEINHPTVKAGEVILQAPQEGTTLRKNDVVVLTVSKGPATQNVPKVIGMSVSDAISALSASGLTLTVVEYVVSDSVPSGQVVVQSPEKGSTCTAGDIINVTVSGGRAVVPKLYGCKLSEAQKLLTEAGLTLNPDVTYEETDDESMHGRIAQQTPSADSEVIAAARVSLIVYRVPSMMAKATVKLSLPQTDSMMSVRVMIVDSGVEYTAYEADYPANASREPEVELTGTEAGTYTYRVYCNDEFAYQQQVNLE